ncbi:hypothetical protein KP509_1Z076500 [Ceratopteris richardii]|nr:hypothetical protein KP509_1Z076500 [Ceratopteris richardii]
MEAVQGLFHPFTLQFVSFSKARRCAFHFCKLPTYLEAQPSPWRRVLSSPPMASPLKPQLAILDSTAPCSTSSASSFSSTSSSSSSSLFSSLPSFCWSFKRTALPDPEFEISSPLLDVERPKDCFLEKKALSRIVLIFVSVFWGTYGPAVRFVYEQPNAPSPSLLLLLRKALSVMFFVCFLPLETSRSGHELERPNSEMTCKEENIAQVDRGLHGLLSDVIGIEWIAAIELGLWTFLGTASQTDGLENTTATRAGFLMQSVTVLVPVLSSFAGVRVKKITWIATFLALLGVTCISLQSHLNAPMSFSWETLLSNVDISKGDLEILLSALFYALCTVRLGDYAAKMEVLQLSSRLMVVSSVLAAVWFLIDPTEAKWQLHPSAPILSAIIFSALVPGTLASLGQTLGQKFISPAEAQVYYSLQPFFSALFAALLLKEEVDMTTWAAGLILFIATLLISIDGLLSKQT